MHNAGHAIPAPVARAFSRLPRFPGSVLFATALNAVLAHRLPEDVRQALGAKRVALRVTDAKVVFEFVFVEELFRARLPGSEAELTISASAYDFYRLARGLVDADTLFFSRRLLLEGDTDLGVRVKYALDAMDLPALVKKLLAPSSLFSRLRSLGPARK